MILDPNRLFPADSEARSVAARLYETVRDLPIISPHGHTDPRWFAENEPFANPTALFIQPDHYIFRMMYSQGISLESLGIPPLDGTAAPVDPKEVWRIFARNYYLFRGTPTRLWLDYSFENQFGLTKRLSPENADEYYEIIARKLQTPEFRPRALYERFNIEVLSTTDTPLDTLEYHKAIKESGWKGRILPTFRPDPVIDADYTGFLANIQKLGEITGEDTATWKGYLNALRNRRAFFKSMGATATDHGHPTAFTADLDPDTAASLFGRIISGRSVPQEQEYFRGQMLTEMAGMSVEDGLTMQLHPGSVRNHNRQLYERFGRDKGADIPSQTEYVRGLQPLLNRYGNDQRLTFILFTLDESTFSRELAPLAGHYPALKLGPPWWFHDSAEGMMRFREQATETAGFYNTVGFNDDTRALLSIPSRHDVARRIDCAFLGRLVVEHRLDEDEAFEVIQDLTVNLVRKAYKL
ncbi:glucuronate isomerase [Tunturiibacter gelidoferens]|uniref:Uronate isomerase n=2 Tax=Tunturiibacter TaxID=3154218 RepID=A0A7Y9NN86_9BACT|nr:glucuronate isomerase [Edaphobacter lichenicola]MBB5338858.1 glucuronate isomerase [Edaphobacter lichenicola]NYF51893.1 glucuronate isomerase [Edaphobacter lichenicola]